MDINDTDSDYRAGPLRSIGVTSRLRSLTKSAVSGSTILPEVYYPLLPLTARVSEARLGLAPFGVIFFAPRAGLVAENSLPKVAGKTIPCTDPPNPKTNSRQPASTTQPVGGIGPLQVAQEAMAPTGAARLEKRNWTPHSNC